MSAHIATFATIFFSMILVNNYVLVQFLGICPFLGVSKKLDSSAGMGAAVIAVMVIATAVTFPMQILLLDKFNLGYLQTIVFILVIAVLVQLIEIVLKKYVPALYQSLGVYLPLITTNCCVLGVTILAVQDYSAVVTEFGFGMAYAEALVCAAGAGVGFLVAMLLWYVISLLPATARAFPNVIVTFSSLATMIERGVFFTDLASSMISVFSGYFLAFIIALPVAILMAWYLPVRNIIEPWIQFVRNIPPLAYVPLIVACAGVGRKPQIITITIACFLIMCVTIYQGVINVDETLIKAARVLGASDKDIFIRVITPATLPFILTAVRLGAGVALTTLIAAESTGAVAGLGMRIRSLNNSFESAPMLLYVIIIGIIGITLETLIKHLERRLTGWQEKREI